MTGSDVWMWRQAFELLETAERLQSGPFRPGGQGGSAGGGAVWQAPVDIFESKQALWIVAALPGVPAERIQLVIDGSELRIQGVRTRPEPCSHTVVRRLEIPHGRFERRIALPAGRYRLASREMKDGCLVIELSKI